MDIQSFAECAPYQMYHQCTIVSILSTNQEEGQQSSSASNNVHSMLPLFQGLKT